MFLCLYREFHLSTRSQIRKRNVKRNVILHDDVTSRNVRIKVRWQETNNFCNFLYGVRNEPEPYRLESRSVRLLLDIIVITPYCIITNEQVERSLVVLYKDKTTQSVNRNSEGSARYFSAEFPCI